jgi:hypothetical protein
MNYPDKNIIDLANKRLDKLYDWTRTTLVTVSTVFGLFISLKTKKSTTDIEHTLFVATVILFGLCILNGLIFLFGETWTPHKLLQKYLQKLLEGEKVVSIDADAGAIFSFLRWTYFLLLILSFSSLIAYVIYADI